MRHHLVLLFAMLVFGSGVNVAAAQQPGRGTVVVEVRSPSGPVSQAELSAGETTVLTNSMGEAVLQLTAGEVELIAGRFGFKTKMTRVTVVPDSIIRVTVDLESEVVLKEEITVTATRTEQRIEDAPLRVEVLQQEEVEEKALMTPGDLRCCSMKLEACVFK